MLADGSLAKSADSGVEPGAITACGEDADLLLFGHDDS